MANVGWRTGDIGVAMPPQQGGYQPVILGAEGVHQINAQQAVNMMNNPAWGNMVNQLFIDDMLNA